MHRCLALVVLLMAAGPAAGRLAAGAQNPDASLTLRVRDDTGGVIVGALVVVRQTDREARQAVTGSRGTAHIDRLVAGLADVCVASPGFETRQVRGRRLRTGLNELDVTLRIEPLAIDVEVSRPVRDAQLDPRGLWFARVLTPADIAQLPDDPEELERMLTQMAGPGATVRVNGFSGSRLPAKSQIRQIRIGHGTFSAETHEPGAPTVDIVTEPGLDTWHGSLNIALRNGALTARNAFATSPPRDLVHRGGLSVDGPVWRQHTSLSVTLDHVRMADTQTFEASTSDGRIAGDQPRVTDRGGWSLLVEHALGQAHGARLEVAQNRTRMDGLGVGGISLPDRGYSWTQTTQTLRVSETGPLGRHAYHEARFQSVWSRSETVPVTARPAVVVLGAFTSGGAQVDSTTRAWEFDAADDLDLARGRHALRVGGLIQAGRYHSSDRGQAQGTFIFSDLAAYRAGRPITFTRRVGEPAVAYGFFRAGWYVQDDVRVGRALSIGGGLRHEIQSHVESWWNLSPRGGFTWAPTVDGRLVIRGGAGLAHQWFEPTAYEQTLRVDGQRMHDIVVRSPGFPDPVDGAALVELPPGRLIVAPSLDLPRVLHAALAVQRRFSPGTAATVGYTHRTGVRLFRGRDINAPDGTAGRPRPEFGSIIQVESAGRSVMDRLDVSVTHAAMSRLPFRILLGANYALSRQANDTDGPFSLPVNSHDPDAEWGPAANDVRQRGTLMVSVVLPAGFRLMTMCSASSAPPYTITTGRDDNGDAVVNDRPPGVSRNSGRGAAQVDVLARVSWSMGFGKPSDATVGLPDARRLQRDAERDPMGVAASFGQRQHKYRLELSVQAYNLTNRVNPVAFRGVTTSEDFGRPAAALPARRVELGLRFAF